MKIVKLIAVIIAMNVLFCSVVYQQKVQDVTAVAISIKIILSEKQLNQNQGIEFFIHDSPEITPLLENIDEKLNNLKLAELIVIKL